MAPDDVRSVVQTALLAPSVHNTQPWLFRAGSDAGADADADADWIDVLADRTRQLDTQDPLGRELLISCGAAVAHAVLAVRGLGRSCRVEVLPDAGTGGTDAPERIARLHVGDAEPATDSERALLDAARQRHTDRSAFAPDPVPDELVDRLRRAAAGDGVHLVAETRSDAVLDIEVLAAGADRIAREDAGLVRDVADWVRPGEQPTEGVPLDALPHHGRGRGSSLTLRDFDPDSVVDEESAPPAAEHPLLLVLCTDSDRQHDWVAAGAALGRLLLAATAEGLVANPQTQVLELPAPRLQLRNRLGLSSWPQVLLRAGFPTGPGSPRSGRRSVDEVLLSS